jgi:hypothetical protein
MTVVVALLPVEVNTLDDGLVDTDGTPEAVAVLALRKVLVERETNGHRSMTKICGG